MAACAAPIYSQSNKKIAAVLSVSCPLSTYNEQEFCGEVSTSVVKYAEQISKFVYT